MATYTAGCSAVGGFGYASRFTLVVELSDSGGDSSTNKSTVSYNVYFYNNTGGGKAHNHGYINVIQPSVVVRRWHRTA